MVDRRASIGLFAWMLASGCGGGSSGGDGGELVLPAQAVTRLDGELHLHQFPRGAHAWAAFVADSVPLGDVHSDQLVELDTAPTAAAGDCTLYLAPTCAPPCNATSWCSAANTCTALVPLTYVDGGEVDVTGSSIVPTIRMWFTTATSTYDADPKPGTALLFAGGELLQVSGGQGDYRLRGILHAPNPVIVMEPDLTVDVHFPNSGSMDIVWQGDAAQEMVLSISVSRSDGSFGLIRCVMPDTGRLDGGVAASLLTALPPPPRSVRFELERDDEEILKTVKPGVGILAHAGFSTWKNWDE
jgi:hypothetical protein